MSDTATLINSANLIACVSVASLKLFEDYGLRVSSMPSPWFEGAMALCVDLHPNDPDTVAWLIAGAYQRGEWKVTA